MDLIVMLIVSAVITFMGVSYTTNDPTDSVQSVTSTVVCNSTFVSQDLPFCEPSLCTRVKCFTYYQEVLGLWHS